MALGPAAPEAAAGAAEGGAARPTRSVWARAGARSWVECERLGAIARGSRGGVSPDGKSSPWFSRARSCPGQPDILVIAARARIAISAVGDLAATSNARLARAEARRRSDLGQALAWIDAASRESAREGRLAPVETEYFRAYALLGLGQLREARVAIDRARARGDVRRSRADRLAALVELLAGRLTSAHRLAARLGQPGRRSSGTSASFDRVVRALVLDRVGDLQAARAELASLRRASDPAAVLVVGNMLPLYERLYLHALVQQHLGNEAAARILWKRYLARPEPEPPEQELARRHLRELER